MQYISTLDLHCGRTELLYSAGDVNGTGMSSSPAMNTNTRNNGGGNSRFGRSSHQGQNGHQKSQQ